MGNLAKTESLVNHRVHACDTGTTRCPECQFVHAAKLLVGRPSEEPNTAPRVFDETPHCHHKMEIVLSLLTLHSFKKERAGVQILNGDELSILVERQLNCFFSHLDSTNSAGGSLFTLFKPRA